MPSHAQAAQVVRLRPCGLQELSILHGYHAPTAWRWSSRDRLPEPEYRVSGKLLWATVAPLEEWSRQLGKYGDAIDAWARHLGLLVPVRVDEQDGEPVWVERADPTLDFARLYDLLELGRPGTVLAKIDLPPSRRKARGLPSSGRQRVVV